MGRVKRRIFQQSSIGAIYTRRSYGTSPGGESLETAHTADGNEVTQAVGMLLQQDAGFQRLKQLCILPRDEARHDGLL